jgi:hypothetical protein
MPEIFRYARRDQLRRYDLRILPAGAGAELWRITEQPGCPPSEILEEVLKSAEAAEACFEQIERALVAGGWRQVEVSAR